MEDYEICSLFYFAGEFYCSHILTTDCTIQFIYGLGNDRDLNQRQSYDYENKKLLIHIFITD